MINFQNMTKKEAIEYCYKHKDVFISDCYKNNENGEREFDCLVGIIESGTTLLTDLPDYGMYY